MFKVASFSFAISCGVFCDSVRATEALPVTVKSVSPDLLKV